MLLRALENPGKSVKLCKFLYLAITSWHGLKAGALSSGESWLSRKRKYLFLILVQCDTCLECSFYFFLLFVFHVIYALNICKFCSRNIPRIVDSVFQCINSCNLPVKKNHQWIDYQIRRWKSFSCHLEIYIKDLPFLDEKISAVVSFNYISV